MAALPLIPTVPNTPLSTRFANDEDTIENIRLPSGACNYTNLNLAGSGPRCGCRRFFDKAWGTPVIVGDSASNGRSDRSGFCMCDHHACFHDHGPQEGPSGRPQSGLPVEEGVSSHQQMRTQISSATAMGPARWSSLQDKGLGAGHPYEPSLPDTLSWGERVQAGSTMGSLPAIPSQCLLPSDQGSRSSGSQAVSSRPFAGLGLKTLSHIPMSRPTLLGRDVTAPGDNCLPAQNARLMQVYVDSSGRQFLQSLTEVATPRSSQATAVEDVFKMNIAGINTALDNLEGCTSQVASGTVALRTTQPDETGVTGPGSTSDTNEIVEPSLIPRLRSVMNHVANYPITMQNHEQRLTLLEDGSFHNPAVEELQEVHEHLDTRVAELETRVEEVEKVQAAINDVSSIGSRARLDNSFDSRTSNTSSALISAAVDHLDSSRLQALEDQVAKLQASAPPTHARPWEVEVVFIPYGRRLMGIWASRSAMTQRSRGNSTGAMDWAHTQNNSLAAAQASLVHWPDSTWEGTAMDVCGDEHDIWLCPRAFGLRTKVYERLNSRGLVKLIQVTGPEARDFEAAMLSAFEDLPTTLAQDPFGDDEKKPARVSESLRNYLGLQAPWIPLRKLHKDSSLRLLTPAEMVTPALWTVPFLSSVAMRSTGIRRLYVTQPDAYMQHSTDTADWTWQKLRQLPRVYPGGQSFSHTPEADAQEPCWEFDAHLDQLPSVHSSFESQHSLSIRSAPHEVAVEPSSPSDHFSSAADSPNASTTPNSVAAPISRSSPTLRERRPFRPIRARTTSAPSLVPLKPSHMLIHSHSQTSKRRQVSPFAIHHDDTRSSPILGTGLNLKRRRTRSPSRPRDTPRWSVGPPSPYTFMDEGLERQRGGNGNSKRATTPFAYATPHSNATYYGYAERPRSGGDVTGSGSGRGGFDGEVDEDDGGFEHNALTDCEDYEQGSSEDGLATGHGIQVDDDEWHGVQEEPQMHVSKPVTENIQTAGFIHSRDEEVPGGDDNADVSLKSFGSTPSEYPSKQQEQQPKGFNKTTGSPFRIHVDDEEE